MHPDDREKPAVDKSSSPVDSIAGSPDSVYSDRHAEESAIEGRIINGTEELEELNAQRSALEAEFFEMNTTRTNAVAGVIKRISSRFYKEGVGFEPIVRTHGISFLGASTPEGDRVFSVRISSDPYNHEELFVCTDPENILEPMLDPTEDRRFIIRSDVTPTLEGKEGKLTVVEESNSLSAPNTKHELAVRLATTADISNSLDALSGRYAEALTASIERQRAELERLKSTQQDMKTRTQELSEISI